MSDMREPLSISGKRIRRTRVVRTDRFVVVVEVDAVIPDADPSEACFEPHTVELLRQIDLHARAGDVEWLKQHGKVYAAIQAA
jgi:hypothetical protein